MEKTECKKYEECSAPICPIDNSKTCGVWYPDEEICQAMTLRNLPWVKKQKAIAKSGASNEKYFTVPMLESIKRVKKGIEGIDPDQPLSQADAQEKRWMGIKDKHIKAQKNKKSQYNVAKKKSKLGKVGKKRGRPRNIVKRKRGRPRKSEAGDRK